ncbi:MAG: substrate-binding domain-containing protein [Lachnospiraceae bacterium]|nr:substrate-binding domain-containing protein [Lachnospiraceae bacterium]
MKKRLLAVLLASAMAMTALAGCGSSSTSTESSSTEEAEETEEEEAEEVTEEAEAETEEAAETSLSGVKIAYLTPSLDLPFWRYVKYGIENEVENLIPDSEVVVYDSKDDANTQLSNAQDAITKQVDAIIISPTDSASCVAVLSEAEEAGVPVVICDIGTDSGTYAAFISTDNEAGAKELGEYIASLLEDGDTVAQITLNQARINGVLRKDGFDEGISVKDITDVDFKQMEKVNREEGETYAQDLITAYPDLKAIFCHSEDPSMGAVSALQAAGREDVLIAAFDCSDEVVEAIQNGEIAATAAQQPVVMGRTSVQCIEKILTGQEVEQEIQLGTLLVTKDNIDEVYDTLVEVALTDE